MCLSRRLVPGQAHLVTRRCLERRYFLRPSPEVVQIFTYALCLAASRHGVILVAVVCESSHWHAVVVDPLQKLSEFMHDLDQLVARALNAHYGRGDHLWAEGQFSNAEIHGAETLLEKIVYVITGPVKDGLVATPEEWGGLITLPEHLGETLSATRPSSAFFGGRLPEGWVPTYGPARARHEAAEKNRRKKQERKRRRGTGARLPITPAPERKRKRKSRGSSLPVQASVQFGVPAEFEGMPLEEFRALVRSQVEERLEEIYAERRDQGLKRFLGMAKVLTTDPLSGPGETFPTFERNPRLACLDPKRRPVLLAELMHWRHEYRMAREAWRQGNRSVVFPWGTYSMRVHHGALVADRPAA
jgi:REP-associated tyrosine transposase